jgi:hypothetical protein
VRRIDANRSFGYYCLFSIAHNNAENYPLKVLNDAISDHINTVILSLEIAEQKDLFSVLNYSAEEIAVQYLYKAMQISKDTAGDLLKVGVLDSLNQFAAFVSKGREFGIFTGWDETNRTASKRDICPNLENPIVRKVLEDCGAELPNGSKSP